MGKAFGIAAVVLMLLASCEQQRQKPAGLDRTGAAPPARLVYAPPGTVITLLDTENGERYETQITVAPPAGFRGAYTTVNGDTGGFYPGCWACGGDNLIESDLYARLWPLETGKSAAFLRSSTNGLQARVLITVIGSETIETQAGVFDTYVLDGRVEHLSGPRYSAQLKAWWTRDPGWVVKAEGSDSDGFQISSEVTSIRLP